ncbi:MAG: OmpH family outer membrane protein [Alistipes sp.]
MKKGIKFILAVALVMGSTSLFAQKFGRINTQEVIVAMPETATMQTNMQAYEKDLRDNLEAIGVEFNTKLQEYQKSFETLSEAVKQLKQKELQELEGRRNDFQEIAQSEFQKKQNELLAPIIEKAKKAIDKVAAAEGYTAIFDTSTGSLAYFNETTLPDIAPQVKKELGISATAAAPAAPAAAPAAKK